MMENKWFSPTLVEWDELVSSWNQSGSFPMNLEARVAWVTKRFVESHSDVAYRAVYAWLERNLEIAKDSAPASDRVPAAPRHEEITAVYRMPRSTSNDYVATPSVASGSGVPR